VTTIVENGREVQILRDNMPFGNAARGEFDTYFIGYARSPGVIEQMPENMFVGRPPGNYDRLLDFSRAVTGTLFFVPPVSLLESLADGQLDAVPAAPANPVPAPGGPAPAAQPGGDGSLDIGSLRGVSQNE